MTDREFEQCMSAMAAGDRDSLRHIYDAYLKLIYAVVYDTIGQREEAEDVTSEFFIKLEDGNADVLRSADRLHRSCLRVDTRFQAPALLRFP